MRCNLLFGRIATLKRAGTSGVERNRRATRAPFDRLHDYPAVLRLRAGHWIRAEEVHEDEHGFFPVRAIDSSLDRRAGVSVGEPGCAGSDRDGGERREVRHFDFALLLDWRGA